MEACQVAENKEFEAGTQTFLEFVEVLKSRETCQLTSSGLEKLVRTDGFELLRQLLQDHLDYRGPGRVEEPVVGADDVTRTESRPGPRNLDTVVGRVVVNRMGYGKPGVNSLFPLDAALNLPREVQSFGIREDLAIEASKSSYGETVNSVERSTTVAVGQRQAEELVTKAAQDFDSFYETRQVPEEMLDKTGPIQVLTVDQKGIVMRHEGLLEATQKAAEQAQHKLQKRLSPGEKKNRKRMASVAAVYTIEPMFRRPEDIVRELNGVQSVEAKIKRPRPEYKRVWASVEKQLETVVKDAVDEGLRRDPSKEKQWIALTDGSKTQINVLKKHAKKNGIQLTVILDIIHVIEYLWDAAAALHGASTPEAEQWVGERLLLVLHGNASSVAAGMRRSATLNDMPDDQRAPVDKCANYLLNHKQYLKYNQYLAAGYPIATGVIEGACRHLIKDRLDITGARWGLLSAEAILRLRSLRSSGDFEEYWTFHEAQEFKRNYTVAYQGNVPDVQLPVRSLDKPKLRVLK